MGQAEQAQEELQTQDRTRVKALHYAGCGDSAQQWQANGGENRCIQQDFAQQAYSVEILEDTNSDVYAVAGSELSHKLIDAESDFLVNNTDTGEIFSASCLTYEIKTHLSSCPTTRKSRLPRAGLVGSVSLRE